MLKKVQVLMLPAKEKAENCLAGYADQSLLYKFKPNHYWTREYLNSIDSCGYHLYFLTDEEVVGSDNVIWMDNKQINKVEDSADIIVSVNNHIRKGHIKKIIATTDSSLTLKVEAKSGHSDQFPLPRPSQGFLDKYIEAYNTGNKIKEVLVEYEGYICANGHYMSYKSTCAYPHCDKPNHDHLKVNQKDNTITIKPIKISWTREEHISDVKRIINLYASTFNGGSIDQWIQSNI